MISLMLGAGLTVISAATTPPSASSWSCAYVAERLPRTLTLFGDDTVSAGETRAARRRLSLGNAVLTRASSLALAQSLGATRLVVIRCLDQESETTISAQSFDTERPLSGEIMNVVTPLLEIPAAIDRIARRLTQGTSPLDPEAFPPPSASALLKAGPALTRESASERANELSQALDQDPTSLDLRLSVVEALIAARDFEGAIRRAGFQGADAPPQLARALRFQQGAAQLEGGRYAEANDTFEALRRGGETAAVLNNLGVARFRLRDPDASDSFVRAALLVDHRQGDISFNRSLALLFEGRADRALRWLDAALKATPVDARTRLLRVWALRILNRETEREEEWDRLLQTAPSFSPLGNPDLARRLERIFFFERSPQRHPETLPATALVRSSK